MSSPELGITVLPEWIQAEGAEAVLESLARAGATAVATSPYVMAPSDHVDAGREPPIDAGSGKVRLLDRDLWGKRELRCVTAPSFVPDRALYSDLVYQPAKSTALTESDGPKVAAFLELAKARGLEVQLQVQAAIPPGYRVQFGGPRPEDEPLLPDGTTHPERVDKNGSLASPAIVDYTRALLRDVAQAYPMVDAIRVDWPEYPPYSLPAWLFDFGSHAQRVAEAKGYDVELMRRDAGTLQREPTRFLDNGLEPLPGFTTLLDFKADLVVDLLQACRDSLPSSMRLVAHAFPEPWARLSGIDLARVGRIADDVAVKLYTMHWPMMLRNYMNEIVRCGTDWDERAIAARLQELFDTGNVSLEDLRYPEPDEPHPVSTGAQVRKIEAALATGAPILPAAHSYGPIDDALARIRTAFEAGGQRVWINRYGYLSDAKLDGLGEMMRAA